MFQKKQNADSSYDAVANVIGVILMVGLVGIAALIVGAFFFGNMALVTTPSFIMAEAAVEEDALTEFISIRHLGGNSVFLHGSDLSIGRIVDITVASGGEAPVWALADTPGAWKAGETIYLYNTITNGKRITSDRARAAALGVGFFGTVMNLVIYDPLSEVRIYGTTLLIRGREVQPGPAMVNINTASAAQLKLIQHINDARALEIITLRQVEPFASVDDLVRVSGIGPARVLDIKNQGIAYVGDTPQPAWVNINRASFADLRLIIHISDARALQIISLRQEDPFTSVDDLVRVDGIGPARLMDIKNQGIVVV